ncbi:MAG: FAD-dependent oxidoreductase [Euryarchaeota archaeon]|nr:FAD-dependent oxidoreductase [Euryarchaeota archaeon]
MNTDILIIGSGPAGIQAAIYAARRKVDVIILGKLENSSLAKAHVENYFGISGPIVGIDLLRVGKEQAEKFGAKFIEEDALHLERKDDKFIVKTEGGKEVESKAVIFAMGVSRKKLGVKGEQQFQGRGVSYCAECDCGFFKGKKVAVIGDGSAAASSAILLAKYASKVYLISKKLSTSEHLQDELKVGNIEIIEGKRISEIYGNSAVGGIKLDGSSLEVEGVFIELGSKGVIELAVNVGLLPDPRGYIHVNEEQKTSVLGIFACGDICGPPLQLAKAVGEGCIAGIEAAEYVKRISKLEKQTV